MNESVIKDIFGVIGKQEAEKKLIELKKDPHQDLINNTKDIFPFLSVEEIKNILKKHNYILDEAINVLEETNQKYEEKKQAQLLYEKNKILDEKCKKELEDFADIFNSIDPEKIKEIYIQNNYDLNKTSEELYELVQENEKKSEQALNSDIQKKKEDMNMVFAETYKNLTPEEISQEIELHDMIFDKIDPILRKKSIKRYLLTLLVKFQNNLSKEEIEEQFRLNKYDYEATIHKCILLINQKNKRDQPLQQKEVATQQNKENKPHVFEKNDSFTFEYDSEMKEKSKMILIKFNENENSEKQELKEKIRQSIKNHLQKINTASSPNKKDSTTNDQSLNTNEKTSIVSEIKDGKVHAKINFPESKYYCYVGFYKKGDSYCIQFDYLYNLKNDTFVVNKPSLNGNYEFRLSNKSSFLSFYSTVYTSDVVQIQDKDEIIFEKREKDLLVSWDIHSFDPLKSDAFIALFLEEESRANYYVENLWNWSKSFKGSLTFRFPRAPGSYQARVFIGKDLKLSSNTLEII